MPPTAARLTRRWWSAGWMTGLRPTQRAGALSQTSVHGFDLTFAAPESVSLLRALTDDVGEKVMQAAHLRAVETAMTYLHEHAGYTRMHNPLTGTKDLERLPALVAIAYQHATPGPGTRICTPTRSCLTAKPATTGHWCRWVPSRSITRPRPPASSTKPPCARGDAELGVEWPPVDPFIEAEIAGVDRTASRHGRSVPPGCGNGRTATW